MNEQNERRLVVKSAIRVLPIDKILFDAAYQRDVKEKHKSYATDFMPEAMGVPIVAERVDGTLWGVDGRQRIAALKLMGKKEVRCEVFASRGTEHEAEVFKRINKDRVKPTPGELFRAMLAANDEAAHAINDAVREMGYSIVLGKSGRAEGRDAAATDERAAKCTTAVSTLIWIYNTMESTEPIKFALQVIDRCWPGDRHGVNNNIIAGLASYYRRQKGVVDVEYIVPRLQRASAYKILYAAGQATIGNNLREKVADQIEKLIKRRLTKPR